MFTQVAENSGAPGGARSFLDPQTLADDLDEVRGIYADLFAGLDESMWDKPVKGGPDEWTLHEVVAHLFALNGAGLDAVKHSLRGEPYTFKGLDSRYDFDVFNRIGIDDHLSIPMRELCDGVLDILSQCAGMARNLRPEQAALTVSMAIYNRPVRIDEVFSIITFHAGLAHAAQLAEPANVAPLWTRLSLGFRHRVVSRTMRAFSMLYRQDLAGEMRAILAFRVDGPDGGTWQVDLSPRVAVSREGGAERADLTIHLREMATFFRMITGRLNLPVSLLTGQLKLRGDLRLFLRMGTIFSVDARPKEPQRKSPNRLSATQAGDLRIEEMGR